jgi:hypothetical protein
LALESFHKIEIRVNINQNLSVTLNNRSKDKTSTISDEGLLFWWAHEDLKQNYYFCRVKPTLDRQGQKLV